MNRVCRYLILASFLLATAHASIVTDSISLQLTDWGPLNLVVAKFNPALGTLTQVDITFTGVVQGDAKAENTSNVTGQTGMTIELTAWLTATDPTGASLLAFPSVFNTFDAAIYDGSTDYAGTSGISYLNVTDDDQAFATYTDSGDLANFIGTGNLSIPVIANAFSSASGGGNTAFEFITNAGATIEISYTYDAAETPEPGTSMLMGSALLVSGLLARKRLSTRKN